MQHRDEKTSYLTKQLGILLRRLRDEKTGMSINELGNSYDLTHGNLSKIENGLIHCKVITLWKIAEALGMKPSELIKILENELGEDFHLIDE